MNTKEVIYTYPFYITGKCLICNVKSIIKNYKGFYLCERCKKICTDVCIKKYKKRCIRDM